MRGCRSSGWVGAELGWRGSAGRRRVLGVAWLRLAGEQLAGAPGEPLAGAPGEAELLPPGSVRGCWWCGLVLARVCGRKLLLARNAV